MSNFRLEDKAAAAAAAAIDKCSTCLQNVERLGKIVIMRLKSNG